MGLCLPIEGSRPIAANRPGRVSRRNQARAHLLKCGSRQGGRATSTVPERRERKRALRPAVVQAGGRGVGRGRRPEAEEGVVLLQRP